MPIGTKLPPTIPTSPLTQPTNNVPVRDLHTPILTESRTGRPRGLLFQNTSMYNGGPLLTLGTYTLWTPNPLARIRLKKLFLFLSSSTLNAVTNVQLFEDGGPTGLLIPMFIPSAGNATLPHYELDLGAEGYLTRQPGALLQINLAATITGGNGLVVVGGGNEEIDVSPVQ